MERLDEFGKFQLGGGSGLKGNFRPGIGTRHNEKIGHGREKWFAGGGIPTSTAGKLSPEELPACRISSAASRKEERQAQE
jgi:hypothetical protein